MDNYNTILQFCVENGIVLNENQLNDLYLVTEGANIEGLKAYNAAYKQIKQEVKKYQANFRKGDFNACLRNCDNMDKAINQFEAKANSLDFSNTSSRVWSYIISALCSIAYSLIPTALTKAGDSYGKRTLQASDYSKLHPAMKVMAIGGTIAYAAKMAYTEISKYKQEMKNGTKPSDYNTIKVYLKNSINKIKNSIKAYRGIAKEYNK